MFYVTLERTTRETYDHHIMLSRPRKQQRTWCTGAFLQAMRGEAIWYPDFAAKHIEWPHTGFLFRSASDFHWGCYSALFWKHEPPLLRGLKSFEPQAGRMERRRATNDEVEHLTVLCKFW
jgi:hypothetical protein